MGHSVAAIIQVEQSGPITNLLIMPRPQDILRSKRHLLAQIHQICARCTLLKNVVLRTAPGHLSASFQHLQVLTGRSQSFKKVKEVLRCHIKAEVGMYLVGTKTGQDGNSTGAVRQRGEKGKIAEQPDDDGFVERISEDESGG